jgi:hypothetical protein
MTFLMRQIRRGERRSVCSRILARDAELVHWYSANCMKNDEEIRHPSDGIRWKKFIFNIQNLQRKIEM